MRRTDRSCTWTCVAMLPDGGRRRYGGTSLECRPDREVQVQSPSVFGRDRADRTALLQRLEHTLRRAEIQGRRVQLVANGKLDGADDGLIADASPHGGKVLVLIELPGTKRK